MLLRFIIKHLNAYYLRSYFINKSIFMKVDQNNLPDNKKYKR